MSQTTIKDMFDALSQNFRSAAALAKDTAECAKLIAHLDLTPSCRCNPSCGYPWFYVSQRSDLEQLLTLAPVGKFWKKAPQGESIVYSIDLEPADDASDSIRSITIYVSGDAFPPTCKIVEVEEEVPAQPATIRKVRKIQCNQDAPAASVDTSPDLGIAASRFSDNASATTSDDSSSSGLSERQ